MPSNKGDIIGYCCLRIPVLDLRKSVDFYCEVLGYDQVSADYSFGEAHIALKNGNGPSIFLMETKSEDVTQLKFVFPRSFWITNSTGQVTMVELLTNDLLALHERVKQASVHIDHEPEFTNEYGFFTFFDPDGHFIRVVEERGEAFDLKHSIGSALKRELTENENKMIQGIAERISVEQQKFLDAVVAGFRLYHEIEDRQFRNTASDHERSDV
ncbi:hypothetical protein PCCS19_00300 [Paenibacillus sp. CCS19]|uniref:VOC family protein n=1 Tax=Paenibacillus sp. CCS19 TaxID=3158387 RepID=UPI002561C706|nr:VOC family protein [Paenibacillus cellulosilyticus]GMK36977.1 hypothetical protein PCCS19_00300 [Paenibacillus cellulosilyticus]